MKQSKKLPFKTLRLFDIKVCNTHMQAYRTDMSYLTITPIPGIVRVTRPHRYHHVVLVKSSTAEKELFSRYEVFTGNVLVSDKEEDSLFAHIGEYCVSFNFSKEGLVNPLNPNRNGVRQLMVLCSDSRHVVAGDAGDTEIDMDRLVHDVNLLLGLDETSEPLKNQDKCLAELNARSSGESTLFESNPLMVQGVGVDYETLTGVETEDFANRVYGELNKSVRQFRNKEKEQTAMKQPNLLPVRTLRLFSVKTSFMPILTYCQKLDSLVSVPIGGLVRLTRPDRTVNTFLVQSYTAEKELFARFGVCATGVIENGKSLFELDGEYCISFHYSEETLQGSSSDSLDTGPSMVLSQETQRLIAGRAGETEIDTERLAHDVHLLLGWGKPNEPVPLRREWLPPMQTENRKRSYGTTVQFVGRPIKEEVHTPDNGVEMTVQEVEHDPNSPPLTINGCFARIKEALGKEKAKEMNEHDLLDPVGCMTFEESFVYQFCTPSACGNMEVNRNGLLEHMPWMVSEEDDFIAGILDSVSGYEGSIQETFLGLTRDSDTGVLGLVFICENENDYVRLTVKKYVKSDSKDLLKLLSEEVLPPATRTELEDDLSSLVDGFWACVQKVGL